MGFPQDFGALFFWAFCSLMTLLVGSFAFAAHSIRDDFKDMSKNIKSLSISVVTLTIKLDSLDDRLEKLERRRDD